MVDLTLVAAPKEIKENINLSTSKSISNRLLIMQALSKNGFEIKNISDSVDTEVLSKGLKSVDSIIDIGAAGTSMRFLTAYFALKGKEITLTGSERMQNRPIGKLVEALQQLGAKIEYVKKDGFPPLKFYPSSLQNNKIAIDGSISSQYITALLLIAPCLPDGLELTIANKLVSKAYVKLTLKLMEYEGISYEWGNNTIIIPPQQYNGKDITVEADWSGASYWYSIVSLLPGYKIKLKGLQKNSLQGDSVVADIYKQFGVETIYENNEIVLSNSNAAITKPQRFNFNFENCPDLVQTVAVTCVLTRTPFKIEGAETLRIKETDRILALQNECLKFGTDIIESGEGILEWDGRSNVHNYSISIKTYDDHRMAMAFAPACLVNNYNITIEDPEVVKKSYPEFWNHLKLIGINAL